AGAGGADELAGHVVQLEARTAVRHDVARTLDGRRAPGADTEVVQKQTGVVVGQDVVADGGIHARVADAQAGIAVGGIDAGDRQVTIRPVCIDALPRAAAAAPGNVHPTDREVRVVRQADGDVDNGIEAIRGVVDDQ